MPPLTKTLQLSVAYLAIIMAISLFFSGAVYRVSSNSLEAGFDRQTRFFQNQDQFRPRRIDDGLQQIQDDELARGKNHIIMNLLVINIFILLIGGGLSYVLALRTLKPIEEALEAQSRFTADASHELRTPLTAMQTEIEVALRDKKLQLGEAKELLTSNLEEIAKLRALADGLLTLSRHQNGEQIELQPVSLAKSIDTARSRLESIIQETKADVTVSGKDLKVMADAESLIGLLVILIDNALKYTARAPRIEINIGTHGKQAQLTVTDHGVGIKASDLPYIFNRFYRADSSRSKVTSGYGLGLSIAQQMVGVLGGTISASSTPGQGTTMTVRLAQAPSVEASSSQS